MTTWRLQKEDAVAEQKQQKSFLHTELKDTCKFNSRAQNYGQHWGQRGSIHFELIRQLSG